jgi:hypothetical protein
LTVLVKREDYSFTWEPLSIVGKDDPITIAEYAKRHGLIETPGWKRFRRYAKKEMKINHLLKQAHLSAIRNKPCKVNKFGIEIPCNFEDSERLDRENGNNLWKDACAPEMKQLIEYNTFVLVLLFNMDMKELK